MNSKFINAVVDRFKAAEHRDVIKKSYSESPLSSNTFIAFVEVVEHALYLLISQLKFCMNDAFLSASQNLRVPH